MIYEQGSKVRKKTIEEYNKMGEVGILQEKGIELIQGEIIKMSPVSKEHSPCVDRISTTLTFLLSGQAIIRVQNPIEIEDHSEPEPDITLF